MRREGRREGQGERKTKYREERREEKGPHITRYFRWNSSPYKLVGSSAQTKLGVYIVHQTMSTAICRHTNCNRCDDKNRSSA